MKQILKKSGLKFSPSFLELYRYVFSILAITIVSGCSKQNLDTRPRPPAGRTITFTVIERTTNKPIAGASVELQKCSNYDFVFGCTMYSTFTTLTTNTEGKATYSGNSAIGKIEVNANRYWPVFKKTDIQNVVLNPKNIIEINVKRDKTYASTDILWTGQDRYFNDLKAIGLPVDTIVYVDGYGYANNKIYWYINYY